MVSCNIGKNFSTNNQGQRKKSDFYETPFSLTRQFFIEELSMGADWDCSLPILEPACGNGAITKVLKEREFSHITASDIQDQNHTDFLQETKHYPYMVTNPPFSLAYEFIQKAKQIIDNKFAMLLPLSYLHGKKRYDDIYQDQVYPLSTVYIFTRYPMLGEALRDDGKYHTGMMVYAWYVWDTSYHLQDPYAEPIIRWIDNNKYVLKKGD